MSDRSFSLALAIQAIGRRAGRRLHVDDVQAVLGLSMVPCAVIGSYDPDTWTMYARDACLERAGRVLDMTIRAVHPPEAARGLGGAAQFAQHFDASYRPLISGAIANDQPILAWQGWPGDRRLMWGVVNGTTETGIGLGGLTWSSPDEGDDRPTTALERPPLQLYVVETVGTNEPTSEGLIKAAVGHARRMLRSDVPRRFGAVTGPAAVTMLLEALRSKRGEGPVSPTYARGHQEYAASLTAGLASAVRFFARHAEPVGGKHRIVSDSLIALCQQLITALAHSAHPQAARAALAVPQGRRMLVEELNDAVRLATDLVAILNVRAAELGIE